MTTWKYAVAFISVLKLWRFIYCLNGLQYLDNIIIISIWKAHTLSSYHIIAMATHWVPSSDPKWEIERVRCDQNCRWITINIIAFKRPAKSFTKTLVRRARIIISHLCTSFKFLAFSIIYLLNESLTSYFQNKRQKKLYYYSFAVRVL